MHKPQTKSSKSIDDDRLNPTAPKNRSALTFFVLAFALSIPFWIAGALTKFQLLPAIPVSALGLVCMVGAASILVYRENGLSGVRTLLERSFDFKRVSAKIWYLPTILLMPCVMVLSYVVMRLMGVALPAPQTSFATTLILCVVFFVAGLGEELGWSGYAIDPLQHRFGALGRVASDSIAIGWAITGLDRVVVAEHRSLPGDHHLALQQHGRERFHRSRFSRHDQRHVFSLPDPRLVLRSSSNGFDRGSRGRNHHCSVWVTDVDSSASHSRFGYGGICFSSRMRCGGSLGQQVFS
jgi:membrane protease YdiL (CAAX protease family)